MPSFPFFFDIFPWSRSFSFHWPTDQSAGPMIGLGDQPVFKIQTCTHAWCLWNRHWEQEASPPFLKGRGMSAWNRYTPIVILTYPYNWYCFTKPRIRDKSDGWHRADFPRGNPRFIWSIVTRVKSFGFLSDFPRSRSADPFRRLY